ncbi:MAG: hypothetical protein K2Q18_07435 [Bdellovibrionales bacterium]|nr:hypothetical protein [Bdellovibrionales bacterium]
MKVFVLIFLFLGFQLVSANDLRLSTDLHFTNRAQCALDSKQPTENALVLLSNMDVGRSLYRLAKVTAQRDSTEFTKLGLNKYRYTVISLLELIHQKIVNNKLPLLPSDLTLKTNLSKYSTLSEKCSNTSKCPDLDNYLKDLWEESSAQTPNFQKIDSIGKQNFLNVEDVGAAKNLNCSYLKKFTPLEAHLFGTKPNTDLLEQIAKATKDVDNYYSECHDYAAQESIKVSTYELSLGVQNSPRFKEVGFDYWNTMKIYFSWAFRNSKEAAQMAFPFDEVFSSVLIEDSLFMVPNGCKSLVSPKCDPQTINQGSVRMFARHDFKQSADSLDIFRAIPEGATGKLLEDPFPEVNADILNFSKFENSDAWLDTFRQNFSETRLTMRKRFVNSVNTLSIMSQKLKTETLQSSLTDYFQPVLSQKEPDNNQLKSELYYLCAESTFLSSEELSYLRSKIEILGKINTTDGLTNSINSKTLIEIFEYYKQIVTQVNSLCSSFDQGKIFDPKFTVDQTGFSRWYTETVYEGKVPSMASFSRKEKLQLKKPLIAYNLYTTSKDVRDVICIDSVDCARVAIQAIVDIYSVNQYSEIFLNIKNEISSANMLNPYAERTACKVYDPWFKTKASLFGFGTDIVQAAISSVTPGVVYGNFDLQPGKVTSFNQLVKDGKIQIDPKYEKAKVLSAVAVDLGSLTGVPCAIAVSKSKDIDPSKVLGFRGVTIRRCAANEKNTINVETSNEIGQNVNNFNNTCLQCSLDFEHVSSAVANVIPFGKTAFFMARAVIRLYKGMKDPVNVPRSWSVNPYLVKAAFDSNGGRIPNDCVQKLIDGKACMKTSCEETIVTSFKKNGLLIDSLNTEETFRGVAKVKLKGCKNTNSIRVYAQFDENNNETCSVAKNSYNLACEK